MYDISIVIVNYNVKDLAYNCINSIYKCKDNYSIEIFFVDNNSIDGSSDLISEKYPEVNVIQNDSNIGFAKANNIALKKVKGKYILILNPDTILEENTFHKLIEFIESNEKVGAVTSKLILKNGKLDSACRRSFPTLSAALPRILGLSKLFPKSKIFSKYNLTYLDENETTEVDAISGAFMFIPREVLKKTGLFDEDYFMYGEDIDLCYKIKKAGYKIYYYPKVNTVHLKGESTKKTRFSYVNNFYGAMSIFVRKNFSNSSKILIYILQFGILYRSVFSYLKRFLLFSFPVLIDATFLYLAFFLSIYQRFQILPNSSYMFIISVYISVWILILIFSGTYLRKNRYSLLKTFNSIIFGFFINSSITYFFKQYAYSREVVIFSAAFALIFLLSWRFIVKLYMFFKEKNILLSKINLLVVSDKKIEQNLEEKFNSKYNVIYYEYNSDKLNFEDIKENIIINGIKEVVFSGDRVSNQIILKLIWFFRGRNINFKVIPSENKLLLSKIRSDLDNINLIEIEYNIKNKLNIFSKRIFDLVFSVVSYLILYPFLSGRYVQLKNLPNVIKGKYSLVGVPVWYEDYDSEYLGKRGLTGLIQINTMHNLSKDEESNFLIYYAKNQSLKLDIEIILKTIITLIKYKK